MFGNNTIRRLEEMLDTAIEGTFEEKNYDETRLSRLESRWKEFLGSSVLSNKNLESERHRLEQFISDISHQTKTPMAVIKMYTELLVEETARGTDASVEKIKAYAKEISRQSERLEFLIDSLTKLSRLENGTLEVIQKQCSVDELIKAAVAAIRPKADKKNLRIELPASYSQSVPDSPQACTEQLATQKPSALATSDETARFDMKWTTEALVNVLDNAVKYSPEHGTIRIKIDKYEMYLAIHVIDEGHGISEAEIAKIFGRFYRSSSVQQEEGVGIGLYLTREILAKEDGYIKAVPNSERKGGELIIYLRR